MTAKITSQIAPQNFEIIRDQIGGILLTEFLYQYSLNNNKNITPTAVDIERFVAIDDDTFPIIVVSLASGKYDNKDYSGTVRGDYCYYIEVYTGRASDLNNGGDHKAMLDLQKMIGIARAILEDPQYATLGFDPKTAGIENVSVESFWINDPKNSVNAIDFICGQIKFWVKATETVPLVQPVPLGSVSTRVNMYGVDNYLFWFNGSGVVDIPQNINTVYRSIELFIKDVPDTTKTIAVGNGLFIQQEYAPGPTLTPLVLGQELGYLAGKLIYRPLFYNDKAQSLFDFDIPTGVYDRSGNGGFNDNTSTGGEPDCVIINFRDYE